MVLQNIEYLIFILQKNILELLHCFPISSLWNNGKVIKNAGNKTSEETSYWNSDLSQTGYSQYVKENKN